MVVCFYILQIHKRRKKRCLHIQKPGWAISFFWKPHRSKLISVWKRLPMTHSYMFLVIIVIHITCMLSSAYNNMTMMVGLDRTDACLVPHTQVTMDIVLVCHSETQRTQGEERHYLGEHHPSTDEATHECPRIYSILHCFCFKGNLFWEVGMNSELGDLVRLSIASLLLT